MTRLCLFLIVLATVVNWSWVSISTKTFSPLPDNVVSLVVGFSGAKVVQRFAENSTPGLGVAKPTS